VTAGLICGDTRRGDRGPLRGNHARLRLATPARNLAIHAIVTLPARIGHNADSSRSLKTVWVPVNKGDVFLVFAESDATTRGAHARAVIVARLLEYTYIARGWSEDARLVGHLAQSVLLPQRFTHGPGSLALFSVSFTQAGLIQKPVRVCKL